MNGFWTPEVWDRFSTVGLVLAGVFAHAVAYVRGWLIPGRHHREIVDARDREIEKLESRSADQDDTIKIQAETIRDKNAIEVVTKSLMQQIRALAEGHRE